MKYIVSALLAVALLTSCGSKEVVTKGERYDSLYNEKPVTLLVMPPINKTEAVEANPTFTAQKTFTPFLTPHRQLTA